MLLSETFFKKVAVGTVLLQWYVT